MWVFIKLFSYHLLSFGHPFSVLHFTCLLSSSSFVKVISNMKNFGTGQFVFRLWIDRRTTVFSFDLFFFYFALVMAPDVIFDK
jgi:hypothetical protein